MTRSRGKLISDPLCVPLGLITQERNDTESSNLICRICTATVQ